MLRVVRDHLKRDGRFWLDIFLPDLSLIPNPSLDKRDPHTFFVPQFGRTVAMTTSLRRVDTQVSRVTFHYTWFDKFGRQRRQKTEFAMTYVFPRELQVLLERNGLKIEHMWGNYDGSRLKPTSPRIIACCCRM